MEEFVRALSEAAEYSGTAVTGEQAEKMVAFYALLEEANRSFNLTAIEGPVRPPRVFFWIRSRRPRYLFCGRDRKS